MGASYEGVVASVSAKACVNANMKKCQEGEGSATNEIQDSASSVSIVSRGSRPKSLEKWVSNVCFYVLFEIVFMPS